MSKFKMTVFSEIPVHPITLDEVKGGLANPLGTCTGGSCNYNGCTLTLECGNKCKSLDTQCNPLGCANKTCSHAVCRHD